MKTEFLFAGLGFLFRFLPVFLAVYYLTPARFKSAVLFIGSILYYAFLQPRFAAVLFLLTLANWLLAKERSKGRLVLLVFLDAGLLAFVKIFVAARGEQAGLVLPLGISFYVFKMLSFQADLYRGKIEKRPGFWDTVSYFVLFPQLLEGPIARFSQMKNTGKIRAQEAEEGLMLLMAGVCMKVLLADRLGGFFQGITRIGYDSISTPLAWLGAYGFSFQLYYDFWAYSLMAAGIGMLLGFPFIENFRHPYAAKSVSDFYRRWHTTLGTFFRDYVYIPLGGSRGGTERTVLNLLIVWILTGLWHGQSITFLVWAGVLFLLILWEKFVVAGLLEKHAFLGRAHVLVLIPLTWVIFALPAPSELILYFSRLFPFFGTSGNVNSGDFIKLLLQAVPEFVVAAVLLFPQVSRFFVNHKKNLMEKLLLFLLFWYAVYRSALGSANPFMYLQF